MILSLERQKAGHEIVALFFRSTVKERFGERFCQPRRRFERILAQDSVDASDDIAVALAFVLFFDLPDQLGYPTLTFGRREVV